MDSKTRNELRQPHDKLFFHTLKNKNIARDILRSYLPEELLAESNLNEIKLYKTKLISPQYKQFEADIIYEVPFKEDAGLFLFHCEHQSTIDKYLPLRLWQYLLLVLMEYAENHPDKPLPVIYPMILYTGEAEYSASTNLFDLFNDQKELVKRYLLSPIRLLDVCRMEDDEIRKHTLFGLTEFAFKYKNTHHFQEFLSKLFPLIEKVESQTGSQYIRNLLTYVLSVFTNGSGEQYERAANKYLSEILKGDSMTIAEQLIEQGMQQGMQRGREEGVQKGVEQVAKKLLEEEIDELLIVRATGLSLEQIHQIKQGVVEA